MSRLPIVQSDLDNWGTILNDYLLQAHKADGTLKDEIITAAKISAADVAAIRTKLDIYDEGAVEALIDDLSGVTDVPTARSNLSVYSQAQVYTQAEVTTLLANYLLLTGGELSNFLTLHADPTSALHAATKQYVDALLAPVKHETFLSSGTFTVPEGVTKVLLTGIAGGASGASGPSGFYGGGGGSGGQAAIDFEITGLTPLEEITVTIGTGGTAVTGPNVNGNHGNSTSFGAHLVLSGGYRGLYNTHPNGGAGRPASEGGTGGDGAATTGDKGGNAGTYGYGGGGATGVSYGGGGGGGGTMYGSGGSGAGDSGTAGSASANTGAGGGGIGSGISGAGGSGQLTVKW